MEKVLINSIDNFELIQAITEVFIKDFSLLSSHHNEISIAHKIASYLEQMGPYIADIESDRALCNKNKTISIHPRFKIDNEIVQKKRNIRPDIILHNKFNPSNIKTWIEIKLKKEFSYIFPYSDEKVLYDISKSYYVTKELDYFESLSIVINVDSKIIETYKFHSLSDLLLIQVIKLNDKYEPVLLQSSLAKYDPIIYVPFSTKD